MSQVYARGVCYLFDVLAADPVAKDAVIGAIKHLMESHAAVKIIHDSSTLTAALRYQLSIEVNNLFDTQVSTYLHPQSWQLTCTSSNCNAFHMNASKGQP